MQPVPNSTCAAASPVPADAFCQIASIQPQPDTALQGSGFSACNTSSATSCCQPYPAVGVEEVLKYVTLDGHTSQHEVDSLVQYSNTTQGCDQLLFEFSLAEVKDIYDTLPGHAASGCSTFDPSWSGTTTAMTKPQAWCTGKQIVCALVSVTLVICKHDAFLRVAPLPDLARACSNVVHALTMFRDMHALPVCDSGS